MGWLDGSRALVTPFATILESHRIGAPARRAWRWCAATSRPRRSNSPTSLFGNEVFAPTNRPSSSTSSQVHGR